MRYMPYATQYVYSLLKIGNAAFLAYLWQTYTIIAHDNYSRRIALILTNNMSTIVIMIITVFQLGNAYVALPFNFSIK